MLMAKNMLRSLFLRQFCIKKSRDVNREISQTGGIIRCVFYSYDLLGVCVVLPALWQAVSQGDYEDHEGQ